MNIGYACLTVGVPGSAQKSTILKNASPEKLFALIEHNLSALRQIFLYNAREEIRLFRISSDLIPFGSSVAFELPWEEHFRASLQELALLVKTHDMRLSMHPGQYTLLNSPHEIVLERAKLDLLYHARVLDSLGLDRSHKIVLHVGGVYGDKVTAKERFLAQVDRLPAQVRSRLILENDGDHYHIEDVLELSALTGLPVVYDNLHNATNPSTRRLGDAEWISLAKATWRPQDGRQKVHYSEQAEGKRIGAHSETIAATSFLSYVDTLYDRDIDIMLEVKDKNRSAIKCRNLTESRSIKDLEAEWARYKYLVLEHSKAHYDALRALLKDKSTYPVLAFYQLIEQALRQPVTIGSARNAAEHVFGYFRDKKSPAEHKRFMRTLERFSQGEIPLSSLKGSLEKLAEHYEEPYLLNSYYFL